MAIILPQQQTFGGNFGAGLGQGLSTGLQYLLQQKMDEVARQRQRTETAQGLKALFPTVSEKEIQQMSNLPPELLSIYLKQTFQKPLVNLGAQGPVEQSIEDIISGKATNIPQAAQIPAVTQMPQVATKFTTQDQVLLQQLGISPEQLKSVSEKPITQPTVQQPLIEKPREILKLKTLSPGAKGELETQRLEKFIEDRPNLSADQKTKIREKIEERQEKFSKQQQVIDKDTKEFYDKINNLNDASTESNIRLNEMEKLIQSGELPSATTASILNVLENAIPIPGSGGKSIGINLKGLFYSPSAQEFEKLSKDFLKNAKNYFGSRVTQGEIELFLKTIPDLTQSDEGKLRIIDNMKLFNEINKTKHKAMTDIINENLGHRPKNLDSLVEERTKSEIDRLTKEFKKEIRQNRKLLKSQIQVPLNISGSAPSELPSLLVGSPESYTV